MVGWLIQVVDHPLTLIYSPFLLNFLGLIILVISWIIFFINNHGIFMSMPLFGHRRFQSNLEEQSLTKLPNSLNPPAYCNLIHVNLKAILQPTNLPNLANSKNAHPIPMVLHIFVIHRPDFEANGTIFVVAMNGQAFYRAKQGESKGERDIAINLKVMPRGEEGRENTLIIKSFYERLKYMKF